ncbi:MAG: hypothetical protein ACT4ON_08790 [Bacteroidota bacterium]
MKEKVSINKYLCLSIALLLLTYSSYRSFNLPFTHDESNSYLHGVHHSFMEIVSNNMPLATANNHMLNTLFMKFFESLFGSSVFALRLQSLIAHGLFLLFTFLLLKDLRSTLVFICGFILLNLNPYLFDFFSLARGYALAIAFMLISLYFLLNFIKNNHPNNHKNLWFTLVFGSLAVLANFALFNYFAALLLLIQLHFLRAFSPGDLSWKKYFFQKNKPVFITILILGVICFEPIRKLIKFNCLYFGGDKGFWQDTVGSLIQKFTYNQNYQINIPFYIQAIIILFLLFYIGIFIYRFLKKDFSPENDTGFVMLLLLCSMVTVSVTQNLLLGTMFVMERFALFFFPIFMICFIYFFDALHEGNKFVKIGSMAFLILCSSIYSYHFYRTINVTYCDDWRYDADTLHMLQDIEKQIDNKPNNKINLGVSWYFSPTINFYRKTKKLTWLNEVNREGPIGKYDYYFAGPEALDTLVRSHKTILKSYPVFGGTLLK